MKKKGLFATGIMVLMVTVMTFSAWAVPPLINYQGKLTDVGGNPLNGNFVMIFHLYDVQNGGEPLWSGEYAVDVIGGIYNVQLGSVSANPFPEGLFENEELYLEVVIPNPDAGLDEILSPRQRLISTPYTMKAGDAETLNGYDSSNFLSAMEPSSMEANTSLAVLSITNTGSGDALSGSASSNSGRGVAGVASGSSGLGVYGEAQGDAGAGVYGEALGSSGIGVGGHADNMGDVTNYGGWFLARGSSGRGVWGYAYNAGNAENYGGYFVAQGSSGTGVYGKANNSVDAANYGGYFEAAGGYGKGVYGHAYNTGYVENYGGYFVASGRSGVGVKGYADGSSGTGVYGYASNLGDVTNYGGWFVAAGSSGTGVLGSGNSYDFYASGSGNYGPFTGGHEVKLSDDFAEDVKPGMIVSVTGETKMRKREDGSVSISSTLPTVALSKVAYDKTVFGVFGGGSRLHKEHWYQSKDGERFGKVNALGEGRVWVSNINGEIRAGDYITTSSIPGYGQRQADDLLHSYTLGKAIETLDWDSVTEVLEINGQLFKIYLIAVVYTSG